MPEIAKVAKRSGRGSKPGERRGGRKPGTPNKITRDIREAAQKYGASSIEGIARMTKSRTEAIKLAAYKELLDRGYGRPAQSLDIETKTAITVNLTTFSGKQLPIASMAVPTPWAGPALLGAASNGSGNGSTNGSSDPTAE